MVFGLKLVYVWLRASIVRFDAGKRLSRWAVGERVVRANMRLSMAGLRLTSRMWRVVLGRVCSRLMTVLVLRRQMVGLAWMLGDAMFFRTRYR